MRRKILLTMAVLLWTATLAQAQDVQSSDNSNSSAGGSTASAPPPPPPPSSPGAAVFAAPAQTRSDSGGRSSSGESGRAGGQRSRGSDGSGGSRAVPRNGRPSGGSSDGGSRSGTSDGGRTGGGTTARGRNAEGSSGGSNVETPPDDRSRNGRPATGVAVRRPPGSTGGGTTTVVVTDYGGYYPWGYGGLGIGGYYGGYYDPWWDPPYQGGGSVYGYGYDGSLKLKVRPREASVYIDGYFAGQVDEFDGIFQRLRIESGPHRVEIRLDGYEPLSFDVRIQPERTTTYSGELKKLP